MSLDRGAPTSGRFSQAGQRVVERSAEPLRCRPVPTTRRRMPGGLPGAELGGERAGFFDLQFVGRIDAVAMLQLVDDCNSQSIGDSMDGPHLGGGGGAPLAVVFRRRTNLLTAVGVASVGSTRAQFIADRLPAGREGTAGLAVKAVRVMLEQRCVQLDFTVAHGSQRALIRLADFPG